MKTRLFSSPALAWSWGLLALSALAIGLFSLRYALPGMPLPSDLPSLAQSPRPFVVHAVSASLALVLGPLQFVPAWRARFPALHRWVGRAYVLSVAVAWLSSLPLAVNAMTRTVECLEIETEAIAQIGLRMASGVLAQVHLDYVRPGYGRDNQRLEGHQ